VESHAKNETSDYIYKKLLAVGSILIYWASPKIFFFSVFNFLPALVLNSLTVLMYVHFHQQKGVYKLAYNVLMPLIAQDAYLFCIKYLTINVMHRLEQVQLKKSNIGHLRLFCMRHLLPITSGELSQETKLFIRTSM
jgi:hypothetical protein